MARKKTLVSGNWVQAVNKKPIPVSPLITKPKTGSTVIDMKPEAGQVLVYSEARPELAVFTDIGDNYPTWTSGFGGFEGVPRPRQKSIIKWNGFDLAGFDLDLVFDSVATGESIERGLLLIEAMGGRGGGGTIGQDGGTPPRLVVDTAGVLTVDRKAFPESRWVIQDIDWHPDDTITNHAGNRVYALVTLSMLEYRTDSRLRTQADLAARQTGPSGATKTVKAKTGDSLQTIARRYLGDAGKWVQLAKLNPDVRDPRKLKTGQSIKVPK